MIDPLFLEHLKAHGVVAYPTSTLPGLGALPTKEGLDALFSLKKRDPSKPVSLGVLSLEQASTLVEVPEIAHELEQHFPKGSMTFVLKAHQELDARLGGQWVAVRCFAHPTARELVEHVGPITATSANEAGETPCDSAEAAGKLLGLPAFAILPGTCPGGHGSTFVRIEGTNIEIIREGVLSEFEIRRWLDGKNDV
jgi:L-threonylcarbamoyladenylate synthase